MENIVTVLARELGKPKEHVQNVVNLIDEGNTIPFIARYRKEMHGTMDDTVLRDLADRLTYLRNLEARSEEIKKAIAAQDKLTEAAGNGTSTPRKRWRRWRTSTARISRSAAPARRSPRIKASSRSRLLLFEQRRDLPDIRTLAEAYVDAEKGVESADDALAGAADIIAETISDDAEHPAAPAGADPKKRRSCGSAAAKEEDSVYGLYTAVHPAAVAAAGAPDSGDQPRRKGGLSEGLGRDSTGRSRWVPVWNAVGQAWLAPRRNSCAPRHEDGYDRLLFPSMEREIRAALTDLGGGRRDPQLRAQFKAAADAAAGQGPRDHGA